MIQTEITPTEQADRLAIRELVDAYAHCADRRDAGAEVALHRGHALPRVHGWSGSEPTQVLHGREALTPVFDDLNRYQATMHFNGQITVALDGDQATGESYCIAHHLFTDDGERKLDGRLAPIRRHVRQAQRRLAVRPAQPLRRLDRDPTFASLALRPGQSFAAIWIGGARDRRTGAY